MLRRPCGLQSHITAVALPVLQSSPQVDKSCQGAIENCCNLRQRCTKTPL